MENVEQEDNKIISPSFSCFILIFCYFIFLLFSLRISYLLVFYCLLIILVYLIILILVFKGIVNKSYNLYFIGLITSLIFSIILTILKIIILIYIMVDRFKDGDTLRNVSFQLRIYFVIITIFINWILTRILLSYKNDVKEMCETNLTITNLINNNNEIII